MPYVSLDVDVSLDEFEDKDLLEEVKLRGLLNSEQVNLIQVALNSGARVIQTGICEPYEIAVGDKSSFKSSGKATIIVLEGE